MANFKTHISAGIVASCIAGPVCYFAGYIGSIGQMLFAIFLLVIGSILPDIDARNSMPTKILKRVLPFFVVLMLIAKTSVLTSSSNFNHQMLLCLMVFLGARYLLPIIWLKLTYHRGIVHSVPMGVLIYLLLSYWLINIGNSLFVSFVLGGFLLSRFLLHLILSLRHKNSKSFGADPGEK